MSWFFWKSPEPILTGVYPGGQKLFRCSFPLNKIGNENLSSEWQTSGNVNWILQVETEKTNNTEMVKVAVECQLNDNVKMNSEKDWSLDVDIIVRLANNDDPGKHIFVRGTNIFENENIKWTSDLTNISKITSGFIQDGEVTFEVEIGVKCDKWPIDHTNFKCKKDSSDTTLIAGTEKFYVEKKVLSNKSSFFDKLLNAEGKSGHYFVYNIEEVDANIFHILLKYAYDMEVKLSLDQISELIPLSERFEMPSLRNKCEECLKNTVADDALVIKLADKFKMQDVIVSKLKSLNTLADLKVSFKHYRGFSDETMRLLLKKLIEVT